MAVIYGAPPVDEPDMDKWGPKILEYLKTRLDLSMVKDSNQASRYAVSSVDGSSTPSLTGSGSGQNPPASIVTSFIGRTGDIQPESEDYSAFYLGKTATAVAASELSPGAEINGVNFTGASNITVAAAANTLTGTTLASNVVNSSLTSVADNAITNAMLAEMPAKTIKGNDTTATANAIDLTAAQVTAMLDAYSGSAQGLVPAGTSSTTNYLREDGTWAAPASGGMTNPMTTPGDIITGGTSGTPQRLGIGPAGTMLASVSGALAWGNATDLNYSTGVTVDSLRPAQAGADVTASHQSASTISLANFVLSDNMVQNPNFSNGLQGWTFPTGWQWNPASGLPIGPTGVFLVSTSTQQNVTGLILVPIDNSKTYLLECWTYASSNCPGCYFGFKEYDYAGNPINHNSANSAAYCLELDTTISGVFYSSAEVSGNGGTNPSANEFNTSAVTITPILVYNNGGGTSVGEIGIMLFRISEVAAGARRGLQSTTVGAGNYKAYVNFSDTTAGGHTGLGSAGTLLQSNGTSLQWTAAPTLSSLTISSGTLYQNTSGRWMTIIENENISTGGSVVWSLGPSSPPTAMNFTQSTSGIANIPVPPGWYYSRGGSSFSAATYALYEN